MRSPEQQKDFLEHGRFGEGRETLKRLKPIGSFGSTYCSSRKQEEFSAWLLFFGLEEMMGTALRDGLCCCKYGWRDALHLGIRSYSVA